MSWTLLTNSVRASSFVRYFKPFFGFLSGDVIAYLIGLVTFSFVARMVGPEGYGYLALGRSVTVWLELMVVFGMNLLGAAWVGAHPDRALHILGRVLGFRSAVAISLSIGLCGFAALFVRDPVFQSILWARCALLLATALNIGYLFVGLSRPLPFVISNVVWRAVFLLLLWVTLSRGTPLALIPLENGLVMLGVYGALIAWGVRAIPRSVPQVRSAFVLPVGMILRRGIPVMLSNAAIRGYHNLDILLLGIWATTADVGAYAAATRILQVSLFVLVALLRTFGPRLAAVSASGNKVRFDRAFIRYKRVCWSIGLLGAVGIFMLSKPATILILGRGFDNTAKALRILSLSFLTIAMHTPYSSAFPFVGAEKDYLWVNAAGFLINGLSNLVLVPHYGYVGSSIAAAIGGVAMLGYAYLAFNRWYSRFNWTTDVLRVAHE